MSRTSDILPVPFLPVLVTLSSPSPCGTFQSSPYTSASPARPLTPHRRLSLSPVEAIKTLRAIKPNDQYLPSFVIADADGTPVGTIEDGDAVALINFRADRMVELSKAFEYEDFKSFDRVRFPKTLFAGLMQYDGDLKLPKNFLVPPPDIQKTSGEWLVKNGVRTFACSETQKFGHVTFFWNGNRSVRHDESGRGREPLSPSESFPAPEWQSNAG